MDILYPWTVYPQQKNIMSKRNEITSVADFIDRVIAQTEESEYWFWFRGHSAEQWELLPSILREKYETYAYANLCAFALKILTQRTQRTRKGRKEGF